MWISGTGITPRLYRIRRDFKVDTELAIKWIQGSAGNWVGTDRGSDEDVYKTKIKLHRREWGDGGVNDLLTQLEANRSADNHLVVLSSFASNEKIFGADLDYSGNITCTVMDWGQREQKAWRGFEVELELQALSPSFSAAASLPTLQYVRHAYKGYNEYSLDKKDTYEGSFTMLDMEKDAGVWEGRLQFSSEDMGKFRRYVATQREGTISIPDIKGVAYPFGPKGDSTYPISVKVLEVTGDTMVDLDMWTVNVVFAEVVS